MNNICNRNCNWNYKGQCCPEDGTHYEDGTAYTSKCTEYLHEKRIDTQMNMWSKCKDILNHCNYVQLKKAYYLLRNIDKAITALNKQIPKIALEIRNRCDFIKRPIFKDGYCPCCKNEISSVYFYCNKCGQAISWEE